MYGQGPQTVSRIRIHKLAVLDQVDGGPIGIAIEFAPSTERHVIVVLDVGYEFGAFRNHRGLAFLDDDFGRRI